jgi:hypothetical protein
MKDLRLWFYGSIVASLGAAFLAAWLLPVASKSIGLLSLGVFFEFGAIGRVAWELDATAQKHGEPGLLERLKLRKAKPRFVELSASFEASSSVTANLTVTRNPTSLEERVRYLEADLAALQSDVRKVRDEHRKTVDELRAADREHRGALGRAVAEIKAELKDAAVGGIDTDYWWSVFLVVGLVLTNYNDQIAGWF